MFTTPPIGIVGDNEVSLVYETLDHKPEELKKEYTQEINEINRWLGWVKKEAEEFGLIICNFAMNHALILPIGVPG